MSANYENRREGWGIKNSHQFFQGLKSRPNKKNIICIKKESKSEQQHEMLRPIL